MVLYALIIGSVLIVGGILWLIFQRQVRAFFLPLQRVTFGKKTAKRSQDAPAWADYAGACIWIVLGVLFTVSALTNWR